MIPIIPRMLTGSLWASVIFEMSIWLRNSAVKASVSTVEIKNNVRAWRLLSHSSLKFVKTASGPISIRIGSHRSIALTSLVWVRLGSGGPALHTTQTNAVEFPGAALFAPLFHAKGAGLDAASLLNLCGNHHFISGYGTTDIPATHQRRFTPRTCRRQVRREARHNLAQRGNAG